MIKLHEELIRASFRFKRHNLPFPSGINLRKGEFFVLSHIESQPFGGADRASVSEIQNRLGFSKPAISQILNGLESKGFVVRETAKPDRRKVVVILTEKGREAVRQTKTHMEELMEQAIDRFGKENSLKLIELINRLSDVIEGIMRENAENDLKGEPKA